MEKKTARRGDAHQLVELSHGMLSDVTAALEEIDAVNKTIHILSMNARVEAARAGEAGRGFAVVAQELTRLSAATDKTTRAIGDKSRSTGAELQTLARQLSTETRDTRLCDLAHHVMDLVDRNLYERSCDVRWWATDSALVACARAPQDPALAQHASRRLGQILDSYTVYADLVLADLQGRVLCNGRPRQYPRTPGGQVGREPWFQAALATASGSEFGFQSVHASALAGGERVLVYACTVREGGVVDGPVLGVLGIVFRWDALGVQVLNAMPLSRGERDATRTCIVDNAGRVLADADVQRIGQTLVFDGLAELARAQRGALATRVDGVMTHVCYAAAPGFETYSTGWHCLVMQAQAPSGPRSAAR